MKKVRIIADKDLLGTDLFVFVSRDIKGMIDRYQNYIDISFCWNEDGEWEALERYRKCKEVVKKYGLEDAN